MDEKHFQQLLAEKPYDPELLMVYADWLEENGRDDEALAARLRRVVQKRAVILTREQAKDWPGFDGKAARGWFAHYPHVRVFLIGYWPVSVMGVRMMPVGTKGTERGQSPADDDPTSPVLYYRKASRGSGMLVAYVKVPGMTTSGSQPDVVMPG
jgi:uncharacterized protein (TIGR02996 family)